MSLNKSVNWIFFFPFSFRPSPLYQIILAASLSRCSRSGGNYLLLLADVGLKNLTRRISIEIACGLILVQTVPFIGSQEPAANLALASGLALELRHPEPSRPSRGRSCGVASFWRLVSHPQNLIFRDLGSLHLSCPPTSFAVPTHPPDLGCGSPPTPPAPLARATLAVTSPWVSPILC